MNYGNCRNMLTSLLCTALLAVSAAAQERQQKKEIIIREGGSGNKETVIIVEKNGQSGTAVELPETFDILVPNNLGPSFTAAVPLGQGGAEAFSARFAFDNRIVKGLPYGADAITEYVQTLPDGNRITRKSESRIYRDSEGRTRRELSPMMVGMLPGAPDPGKRIQISDPVAGTTLMLDPLAQTVTKLPSFLSGTTISATEKGDNKIVTVKVLSDTENVNGPARVINRRIEGPGGETIEIIRDGDSRRVTVNGTQASRNFVVDADRNIRTENLGKQTIEGVEAEGTRTIETIPAGKVGNERPIEIINERWYSPELQLVLMTRHNDPRFGENVYRVTNIDRSEPYPALFTAPPDYKVVESPAANLQRFIEIRK